MILDAVLADQSPARLVLATFFPLALLLSWIWRLNLGVTRKVPGPWYLKLTTAFVKYREFTGTQATWIHNLHLRYGPVVQYARNQVSFASCTASKQIYSTGNKDFRKTEFYGMFKQGNHINLFTALDPEKHGEIRRQFADRYSNSTVLRSEIVTAVAERAETFATICASTNSADVYFYLHAYALDCVTAMLFHPYGTNSLNGGDDKQMVHLLSYANPRIGFFLTYYSPFLGKLWNLLAPTSTSSEKGGEMIHKYVTNTLARGGHSDFTLAARFSTQGEKLDLPLAISECLDHIGAGIETTGDTLCWLLWALSQPQHTARVTQLHEELVHAHRESLDIHTLPYLGAVVQEALRLWAPGTLPLPRYVPEEGRCIDGYYLPGKMVVGCTAYSMHRLDTAVFPDADEFVPERWFDNKGGSDRQRNFFAFGLGARTCIGKHLAMAEMRACLNAVYSKYRTQPAHDMNADMGLDDQMLTSRPKGMSCKLEFVPWEDESKE
ncbi:cytochrome P450 [Aspergillus pseudoustus]|uniref:Cytochrome P450 n=1 Tax=Aspergillus pseudoustus TaxID=1810923 RepID=A0ABR4IJE1_9EURO